jgi:hypothetical protein
LFSFFRINDPYRLIIIFLILIIISLPFFIGGRPLTIPELTWMVVGEKMSEGSTLYIDIWSNISPLAAAVYWLIDEVFGRSQLTYQIIGLLLVMVQSTIFNNTLLHFKAYNENNYVPAFIYTLLMTSHFDFFTLSPILMSLTLLLHVIHLLFKFIQLGEKSDEMLLQIGVFLSLAVLFFLPMFLFIIVIILSFLLFTGVSVRRILLFLYGFLLPLTFVGIYYYFKDGTREFLTQYIFAFFVLPGEYLVSVSSLLVISAIPLLYLFMSIIKVFGQTGFTNFQVRLQQIMFLMIIVAVFIFLLANNKAPYQLAIFVPPTAFFISHYFLLIRKRFWTEFLFIMFLLSIVLVNWGSYYNLKIPGRLIDHEKMLVQPSPLNDVVAGQRILVLGDDINVYQNAQLATPYLDWRIARVHFHSLDYYDNLTAIYRNIMEDTPDIVVDLEGIMPNLISRIPALGGMYVRSSVGGVYRKRP